MGGTPPGPQHSQEGLIGWTVLEQRLLLASAPRWPVSHSSEAEIAETVREDSVFLLESKPRPLGGQIQSDTFLWHGGTFPGSIVASVCEDINGSLGTSLG